MRTRYLLCYDIRNEKRLRRAAKVAETFGYRVQYSVFLCDLSDVERARLERKLQDAVNAAEDQVLLVDLGPANGPGDGRLQWLSSPPCLHNNGSPTIV